MNYQESLKFIEESHKFGIRLGLENSLKLLELLGNPQDKLKIIHVAELMEKVQYVHLLLTHYMHKDIKLDFIHLHT